MTLYPDFELGESSKAICVLKPMEDEEDVVSVMPLVVVEDPVDALASSLTCAPLMMVLPSGTLEETSETHLEPSVWVKQRH